MKRELYAWMGDDYPIAVRNFAGDPFIVEERERAERFRGHAEEISTTLKKPIRLIKFVEAEEITVVDGRKKPDGQGG